MASRLISTLVAFHVGFAGVTAPAPNILTCETMVYFAYYRAGITFSLWLHFVLRELFDWLHVVVRWLTGRATNAGSDTLAMLYKSIEGFAKTLLCALVMNTALWLAVTATFWPVATVDADTAVAFATKRSLLPTIS